MKKCVYPTRFCKGCRLCDKQKMCEKTHELKKESVSNQTNESKNHSI